MGEEKVIQRWSVRGGREAKDRVLVGVSDERDHGYSDVVPHLSMVACDGSK